MRFNSQRIGVESSRRNHNRGNGDKVDKSSYYRQVARIKINVDVGKRSVAKVNGKWSDVWIVPAHGQGRLYATFQPRCFNHDVRLERHRAIRAYAIRVTFAAPIVYLEFVTLRSTERLADIAKRKRTSTWDDSVSWSRLRYPMVTAFYNRRERRQVLAMHASTTTLRALSC